MAGKEMHTLSNRDKRTLGGFLSTSIFLIAAIAGVGTAGWFAKDVSLEQFRAKAATQQPLVAEYVSLDIDFLDLTPAHPSTVRYGTLKRRSTLNATLEDLGATPADATAALTALYTNNLLNPRRLQAGLKVTANFDIESGRLIAITLRPEAERSVLAKRLDQQAFFATSLAVDTRPVYRRVTAKIDTSIYEAALKAGAADQQVADFAQIFGYDIDFQREIHPGDAFEIVYESLVDERGRHVRSGEVVYAALEGRALTRGYYRHTPEDREEADYFTEEGKSATRFLMKTPINGARLSSSFGRRRHPISGYSRLHKGTDFAAPRGTPIFAAGHGVVERASRYGGYGNYVRLQHDNGYETAYAHMSRYGPGIRRGKRVRQGDIVGYVGSTGASTGPHLHYEVLINGRHTNAMTLRLPTGRTLEGGLLASFEETRTEIDALRFTEETEVEIASAAIGESG